MPIRTVVLVVMILVVLAAVLVIFVVFMHGHISLQTTKSIDIAGTLTSNVTGS